MKLIYFALFLLLCPVFVVAQNAAPQFRLRTMATTGTPYVAWTWAAPASGAAPSVYNFYQATGSCTTTGLTYTKLASTNQTTWNQTTLPATVTCSYVTAVSAVGVEGPPSPTFQLDLTAPGAPGTPQGTYKTQ